MAKNNIDMTIIVGSADKEAVTDVIKGLKGLGFTNITHIDSGISIVKKISEEKFDFILCDQNLKFISGWLLIKEIKTSDRIPNIPVILFGRAQPPASESELKQYGIVKYIKIPSSVSDISFTINSTLQLFTTSGTIENKYTKAKRALIEDDSDAAVEMYSELRGLTAKNNRSSIGLAQAYIKGQDQENARVIVREIADSGDSSPSTLLLSARMELEASSVEKAWELIQKLLTQLPEAFYFNESVKIFLDFKYLRYVKELCNDAIARSLDLPDFHIALAKCQYADSQFAEAIETAKSAEQIFGSFGELLNLKGVCYKKTGEFKEAILCYEEALRLSPTDAKVYFNLAICAIDMEDYTLAVRHLLSCLKIAPDFARAQEKLNEIKEKRVV